MMRSFVPLDLFGIFNPVITLRRAQSLNCSSPLFIMLQIEFRGRFYNFIVAQDPTDLVEAQVLPFSIFLSLSRRRPKVVSQLQLLNIIRNYKF